MTPKNKKYIFLRLISKGYQIHNKRCLANPLHISKETELKDLIQEIALVVEWLRVNHGIWVYIVPYSTLFRPYAEELIDKDRFGKWEGHKYSSAQEAYLSAFDYVLKII